MRKCSICEKKHYGRGFCRNHYRSEYLNKLSYKKLSKLGLKCIISDCDKPKNFKDYCSKHQGRFIRYEDPNKLINNPDKYKICKLQKCERKHHALGYCVIHYDKISNYLRNQNRRIFVINYFGSKCMNCGINDFDILSVDHIDNDGYKYKNHVRYRKLSELYIGYEKRIKSGENLKKRYQLLCWNCNHKKRLAFIKSKLKKLGLL